MKDRDWDGVSVNVDKPVLDAFRMSDAVLTTGKLQD